MLPYFACCLALLTLSLASTRYRPVTVYTIVFRVPRPSYLVFSTQHAKYRIDRARDPTQTTTRTSQFPRTDVAIARNVKTEPGAKPPKTGQQQQQQRAGNAAGRGRKPYNASSKFAGATEALAEVIFDIGRESQSKWTNAHHDIEEYALRANVFDNPLTMAQCIKDLVPYMEKIPPMPDFDNMKQTKEDGVTVKTDDNGKELLLTATQIQVAIRLYEKEVEAKKKESRSVRKDVTTLYGQVLGQCTPPMRRSLEGHDEWSVIDSSKDPIKLLKAVGNAQGSWYFMNLSWTSSSGTSTPRSPSTGT